MATVEELQKKVEVLEARLAAAQGDARPARQFIEVMSSEVVDSNPYRYFNHFIHYAIKVLMKTSGNSNLQTL